MRSEKKLPLLVTLGKGKDSDTYFVSNISDTPIETLHIMVGGRFEWIWGVDQRLGSGLAAWETRELGEFGYLHGPIFGTFGPNREKPAPAFTNTQLRSPWEHGVNVTFSAPGYPDLSMKEAMTSRIGIIGLEGSGKSVFATVWTHLLENAKDLNRSLVIENDESRKYLKAGWDRLNDGNWLLTTSKQHKLQWDFCFNGERFPIRLMDIPGQSLRKIFDNDRFKRRENLDDEEANILSHLESCTIVVIMVNLNDFFDSENKGKLDGDLFLLRQAINWYAKAPKRRHVHVLFTAYDRHRSRIEKEYKTIEGFVQKHTDLRTLYNAAYNSPDNVRFHAVAPVNDTVSKPGDKSSVVPKKGFSSYGMNEFTECLCAAIKTDNTHDGLKKGKTL